jgi:hypothetical protein
LTQIKADHLHAANVSSLKEGDVMPLTAIFVLVGILLVFATFALGLAWGDYQTQHLPSTGREKSPSVSGAGALQRTQRLDAELWSDAGTRLGRVRSRARLLLFHYWAVGLTRTRFSLVKHFHHA